MIRQFRLTTAAVIVAVGTYLGCWAITVYLSDRLPNHPVAALVPATLLVACGGLLARRKHVQARLVIGMGIGCALSAATYVWFLVAFSDGFASIS